MDPLADLRGKIGRLARTPTRAGLDAVVGHLEMAERHLDRARREPDDALFNDAVYRSNQAYEGSLKEAWRVLVGGDPTRKKTHELEKGLTKSGVLTERAQGLLQNYRTQWRNPSTHDHTILFGDQDAFLAFWSAIAFAVVLLDQIVSKLSEEEAMAALPVGAPEPATDEPLSQLLWSFAQTPDAFFRGDGQPRSEAEVMGWLSAFLHRRVTDLGFEAHPLLQNGARPDLVVSRGDERMVVEFKRGYREKRSVGEAAALVLGYMAELGVTDGAIVIAPSDRQEPMASWVDVYQTPNDRLFKVIVIAPKRLGSQGEGSGER